jgi:hypothetical protein
MSEYINQLTIEDVKALNRLCFENNEEIDHAHFPIPDDDAFPPFILAVSKYGHEFMIKDFRISASVGYKSVPEAQNIFAAYMSKKFGEQYRTEYTESHNSLDRLRNRAREAQAAVEIAERKAAREADNLRNLTNRMFPGNLEDIQKEISEYEDPEDPVTYDYLDEGREDL